MGEVIVITSGKGGVGKTTTTANIGIGLSQLGKKVIVIDTDLGLRNLDVVMGLENRIVYNLVDVIEGSCRLKQALIRDKRFPELYLLPSAQTKDKTAVSPEQMRKLIADIKDEFDYILLDCPAGIEAGFESCGRGRQGDCSYNSGGICHTGRGPDHRSAGSTWHQEKRPDYQPSPRGYGKARGYDVRG